MPNVPPHEFATGLTLARIRAACSIAPASLTPETVTPELVRDDFAAEARQLAEAGYAGAELPSPFVECLRDRSDVGEDFCRDLRGVFTDAGLSYLTVHGPNLPTLDTPLAVATDRAVWHARVARQLGAASIVMHPTAHSHPHVCTVVPNLLERDTAIAHAVADELGDGPTRLALENLPTYGIAYLIRLMESITDPRVGVCFDTGHWNVRPEQDLPTVLATLGPRVVHLHLSDNHGLCDEHQPPGAGTFDWSALLNHLPESVRDQPWLIELDAIDPTTADDFDAAWAELGDVRRRAIQTGRRTLEQAAASLPADVTTASTIPGGVR